MKGVLKIYLGVCATAGLLSIPLWVRQYDLVFDIRILIFLLLLLLNSNHQVRVGKDSFSINFPLLFPVLAAFGPAWGFILAAVGLVSRDELEDPKVIFLFNRSVLGFSAAVSGAAFLAAGGVPNLVLALLVAVTTYSLVNLGFFYVAKRIAGQSEGVIATIVESIKTILPSFALAALFYYAYFFFDVFGVIGAYYIFITIRSGALFGHLEINYRVSLIKSILRAVYAKDQDLMAHLESVAYYSKKLAKRCGYPRWKLQLLDEASYFHDIGKLEISDFILKKPGKLTDEEYFQMKTHPEKGMRFLQEIPLPQSHKALVENIALYHHERYDGHGYPNGLQGDDIPLEARIVAVADTWDAMVGQRCYRKPMKTADAIAEMRRVKGTQLDPQLVDIFVEVIEAEEMADAPSRAPSPIQASSGSGKGA